MFLSFCVIAEKTHGQTVKGIGRDAIQHPRSTGASAPLARNRVRHLVRCFRAFWFGVGLLAYGHHCSLCILCLLRRLNESRNDRRIMRAITILFLAIVSCMACFMLMLAGMSFTLPEAIIWIEAVLVSLVVQVCTLTAFKIVFALLFSTAAAAATALQHKTCLQFCLSAH